MDTRRSIYPAAPRESLADRLHGRTVPDPYRWLEDRTDERTTRWLARQDDLYAEHMARLPGRDRLAARLAQLHQVGAVSSPTWCGQRWFATRRDGGRELDALYTGGSPTDRRVLVDPEMLDGSGHTTLDSWEPDHEGRFLAYQLSRDGIEEPALWVLDVGSGEVVDGPIDRTRHGSVAWRSGGDAFYYTRRLHPDDVPAGDEQYHQRVYLHRIGEPSRTDTMIFGAGRHKADLYRLTTSPDGRWLIVRCSRGTAPRNEIWIADLHATDPAAPYLRVVQAGVDGRTIARIGRDGRLYLLTDVGSRRRRLAVADPTDPNPRTWTDLLAEDDDAVLTGYALLDGPEAGRPLVLAARSRHAISELTTHDARTGERIDLVRLPGLGSVSDLTDHPDGGHSAWFTYTDMVTPSTVMRYDALSHTVEAWWRPPGETSAPEIDTRQVTSRSADGTAVPLLVVAPAGVLDGAGSSVGTPRPTMLYGYGGFNVSLSPTYAPTVLAWVEAGGTYAIAGVRGGGEEGADWHRAGTRAHKQNTFDDFYAAAEHLISSGWTTAEQLCVSGGSNGGLLVGAAITQRPALFAAALCQAPLLDMVRYERFALGRMWTDEYGSAADPEQFAWLLAYSPYHHVEPGTAYPAVLFSTFGGDTRVDPMHAWKTCAALQHATASADRPVLLRHEFQVGHGARAVSQLIAHGAETLAFAAAYTGLQQ